MKTSVASVLAALFVAAPLAAQDAAPPAPAPAPSPNPVEEQEVDASKSGDPKPAEGSGERVVATHYFWSDQFGLKIQSLGRYVDGDRTLIVEGRLESDDFVAIHGDGARLHAVPATRAAPSLRGYRKLLQGDADWSAALMVWQPCQLSQPTTKAASPM